MDENVRRDDSMSMMGIRHTSRREFIRRLALIGASGLLPGSPAQCQRTRVAPSYETFTAKLVKEFKDAYLLAVSPDNRKICLYFTKNPIDKFTGNGGEWTYEGGPSKGGRSAIEVIEMGSWRSRCSVRLRHAASMASFFVESNLLYASGDVIPGTNGSVQHILIDLDTQAVTEHLETWTLQGPSRLYYALYDGVLLGTESVFDVFAHQESIIRATLPDYRETARAPYSVAQKHEIASPSWVVTSGDRKTVVYDGDHMLTCRRTEDLSLIWSQSVGPEFGLGPTFLSITPDASKVAAAVLDTSEVSKQKNFYIGVHQGSDGRLINKLQLNGHEGIALSPDGSVLAVGRTVPVTRGGYTLTAELFDTVSGRRIAALEHDRFAHIDLARFSGFGWQGLQFTGDGKYLITSTVDRTRVWALVRRSPGP